MVHRSIRNDSREADDLYIKIVFLELEDFLFFSLYSFSCIANQVTTLKQLGLRSCFNSLVPNFEHLLRWFDITFKLSISPTPNHVRFTGTSLS
jgi:hypothetical protein